MFWRNRTAVVEKEKGFKTMIDAPRLQAPCSGIEATRPEPQGHEYNGLLIGKNGYKRGASRDALPQFEWLYAYI